MSIKETRHTMGADILEEMQKRNELPLPNHRRLAKVMMEFWKEGAYDDELANMGSSWTATIGYWMHNLDGVQEVLRTRNKFFEFVRNEKAERIEERFTGSWRFCSKEEYVDVLRRQHNDASTRVDSYNVKVTDGGERWKLDLPLLADIPRLAAN